MPDTKVPFLDLKGAYLELRDEMDGAYKRVMDSGRYLLSSELEAFEQSFATYVGSRFAVGVGSGLEALVLSLRALDIGVGDEVIVPSHTFIATWLAVSNVGANLVVVEPDEETYCVTAIGIERAITPNTRAVIPVHLYGLPCDMPAIDEVARKHNISVIADAAQAHGARIGSRQLGAFGHVSAWSFYPGKNLGAFGDAGAVTTDPPEVAQRLRSLRNYGSLAKYVHLEQGVNSRLDELQAAFLHAKLGYLDEWNARRRQIATRYLEELSELPIVLPRIPRDYESAWHLFVVRTNQRDELQRHLALMGVETLVHYPTPIHQQGAYSCAEWPVDGFPIAERLSTTALSLPIGPHMTTEQVDKVITAVRSFYR